MPEGVEIPPPPAAPENSYIKTLFGNEDPLKVTSTFNKLDLFPTLVKVDERTGLPVEEGEMRQRIIGELSKAIREGNTWAIVYSDLDNLKVANNTDRDLGDAAILWGASTVCSTFADLELNENAVVFAVRQTGAADETVYYAFNVSDEELDQIGKKVNKLNNTTRTIQTQDKPYTCSTSTSIVTSKDHPFDNEERETQRYLREDHDKKAYDFFNRIKQYADDQTKIEKLHKEINNIPLEELSNEDLPDKLNKTIAETFGGSRISTPLLHVLLTMSSEVTQAHIANLFGNNDLLKQKLVSEFGITQDQLRIYEGEEEKKELFVAYFDLLVHRIYEQYDIQHT